MPLSPQRRRPALPAGNPSLANGCQNLPPSTPPPFTRTPNNPEQIRTNLNKPERRRTPRPDREHPQITPNTPEKTKPEHRRRPPAAIPAHPEQP